MKKNRQRVGTNTAARPLTRYDAHENTARDGPRNNRRETLLRPRGRTRRLLVTRTNTRVVGSASGVFVGQVSFFRTGRLGALASGGPCGTGKKVPPRSKSVVFGCVGASKVHWGYVR